jgi:23S rRNA pseudouridine1911/1915/1917 synthase
VNDTNSVILGSSTTVRTITVDAESVGLRIDAFLSANFSIYSRSYIRKLIDNHDVRVDGRSVRASYRVKAGEKISIHEPPPEPIEPVPQDIPLNVVFEDRDILVIDKPPGIVVHPAPGNQEGTLVNALLHHCQDLSGVGGALRPGIVHRLDRDTSGVLVVTKNDRAHRRLAQQFHDHQVEKRYIAFAACRPSTPPLPDKGRIETLFGRHPVHRKRFSSKVKRGKHAITNYKVIRRFSGKDWAAIKVMVELETGRTHQIRVHLSDKGFPILGDKLYGGRSAKVYPQAILPKRQALHAAYLGFIHPISSQPVSFEAPLPQDLVDLETLLARG